MNTTFYLNNTDIHKALLDGIKGAASVALTAATYLIANPQLLGPTTVTTTAVLACLPLLVSLLSRWAAPSASTPTPAPQSPPETAGP